ncbi:hypothetical protein [Halomarina litorea]|uniref:hypothetical protein n=1 Tax=Halomarina litorea TaxID=2961595 RepID=UPI0020C4BAFC|nr:hypothetical protein [Halomarina sp. BCD28]
MSNEHDTADLDELRARAADAIDGDDLRSMYLGVVREDGEKEYYFGNAVDESELREVAVVQLAMMTRVLATQSASSVEEIAELAAQQAESMDLQP